MSFHRLDLGNTWSGRETLNLKDSSVYQLQTMLSLSSPLEPKKKECLCRFFSAVERAQSGKLVGSLITGAATRAAVLDGRERLVY